MSDTPKRKLSVVLFADIAGYTALMQENEKKAMQVIHKFKETTENLAPEYDGKVVQYYGDGCLMTFDSCTQAVQCSLEMQKIFLSSLKVPVRIGIHLGDVVFEDNNAYGDGVNIASRIENLGIPGSILLSRSVMNQVRNKEEFSLLYLGSFELKNVTDPIEVYALENAGLAVPEVNQTKELPKQSKTGLPLKWIPGIIGLLILGILGYQNLIQEDSHIRYGVVEANLEKPGKSYVLTIGVDNNPGWLRLNNAKNDALGFRDVLINQYHFRDLQEPLINEIATGKKIRDAIDKARDLLKENDELIVFFAGHGYNEIIEDENQPPGGYIIPYDAAPEIDNNIESYIKIENFLHEISELPAMHITTIFDACYSGFAMGTNLLVSRGTGLSPLKASRTRSRKVFSSANFDQTAVDNGPIPGHSLFTGILIESLRTAQADYNSDGMISMNELALYIEKNIYDLSPIEQTPTYGFHSSDKGGEMFLIYNPEEITIDKTRSDFIKDEKDIYTVLPFRTSTPDPRTEMLGIYIPQNILDALSEYDMRKYKVVDLGLMGRQDSVILETPINGFLKDSYATKYFAGTYNIFDDNVTIKVCLYDTKDNSIIFAFPDITGNIERERSKEELVFAVKKRIKGFMDNNEEVMAKITVPPNYEAFKQLKSAYDVWCDDREKAVEYMDKAIEIDHQYFRAYLGKAVINVLCGPVNVGKGLEEWQKFKDIDFDLTYYEEERLKNLEYELRGDYEKLVDQKFELYKEFMTKNTFGDAIWHACRTRNIALANEIIDIAEKNIPNDDFMEDIFIWKNEIEQNLAPVHTPVYYNQFKNSPDLVKKNFHSFFRSKMLFDCQSNCVDEINSLLSKYGISPFNYYLRAGSIAEFNKQDESAKKFYKLAFDHYNSSNEKDLLKEILLNYRLQDYDEVIKLAESNLDTLVENKQLYHLRYYIISKIKLNQPVDNLENLINIFKGYTRSPGHASYYLATIYCAQGNLQEANNLLEKAITNGIAHIIYRYNFDPDLKEMWEDPEFKRITKLRI